MYKCSDSAVASALRDRQRSSVHRGRAGSCSRWWAGTPPSSSARSEKLSTSRQPLRHDDNQLIGRWAGLEILDGGGGFKPSGSEATSSRRSSCTRACAWEGRIRTPRSPPKTRPAPSSESRHTRLFPANTVYSSVRFCNDSYYYLIARWHSFEYNSLLSFGHN